MSLHVSIKRVDSIVKMQFTTSANYDPYSIIRLLLIGFMYTDLSDMVFLGYNPATGKSTPIEKCIAAKTVKVTKVNAVNQAITEEVREDETLIQLFETFCTVYCRQFHGTNGPKSRNDLKMQSEYLGAVFDKIENLACKHIIDFNRNDDITDAIREMDRQMNNFLSSIEAKISARGPMCGLP